VITITVAGIEQSLEGLSESWLHEQIRRRQQAGEKVCVQVSVQTSEIIAGVSSGACPSGRGNSRKLTEKERELLALWKHFGLGEEEVNSGKLIAFLQRLRALI